MLRSGPTTVTKADFVAAYAKNEHISVADWLKRQNDEAELIMETKRQTLLEGQRRARIEARDPKPPPQLVLQAGVALVSQRRGADALEAIAKARARRRRVWRRARSCCTAALLAQVRSFGGAALSAEQDVAFVESELLLGTDAVARDRNKLLELGVTHVLKVSQFCDVIDFPQDFVYCTCKHLDEQQQGMDFLKSEFDMGRRFLVESLKIGGRALVCCGDGQSTSVAMVLAFLQWERKLPLQNALELLTLHEPELRVTRSHGLFLGLLELELRQMPSVSANGPFASSAQRRVVKALKLRKALIWPTPVCMLLGSMEIADPYAFWYGKPRKRRTPKIKRRGSREVALPESRFSHCLGF